MARFKPMKPGTYKKNNVVFPVVAYPLVGGVRFIVERISATEVNFHDGVNDLDSVLGHLETPFINLMVGMPDDSWLDGMLYKHGWDEARISAAVGSLSADTLELEAWLYDIPSEAEEAAQRAHRLDHYIGNTPEHTDGPIFRVPFEIFKEQPDRDDVEKYVDIFISRGYIGIMVKNGGSLYEQDVVSDEFMVYIK